MKNLLFLFFLIFSITLQAQNISGLYSGTLYNDTTKQTQTYELALSEYRGKITGYAYATFITNDTFYYSIRKVKAMKKNDQLVVEDADMLVNNFPVKRDKGVRRISTIPIGGLKESDTLSAFNGSWKTTATKEFYSLPGIMKMERDNDSTHSALVAHLTELKVITAAPPDVAVNKGNKSNSNKEAQPKATNTFKDIAATAARPLPYSQRSRQVLQTLAISSDSLVLSFYDNGVVDGDVISVYVNGENIIANSKLLAVATKKTVHLTNYGDEVELLLVAETLGSLPPNTGLLVVQDGTQKYEVRFSADLQTNAAIVFKKRK